MGLTRKQIEDAVRDSEWQIVRRLMKGQSTSSKLDMLHDWLERGTTGRQELRCIQVLNYLNALSRGGFIDPVEQVQGKHLFDLMEHRKTRIRVIK